MKDGINIIISSVLAGVIFLFFLFIVDLSFIISIVISIISLVIFIIVFSRYKDNSQKEIELKLSGIDMETVKQVINDGEAKIKEIESITAKVKNDSVKSKIKDICEITKKIFDNFRKDPKDIKVARTFLSYYLDATIKILKRYVELSENYTISKEVQEKLKKVEDLLGTIESAFEKQLAKLLEDDVMDLDVEISLLEKTLKGDGL